MINAATPANKNRRVEQQERLSPTWAERPETIQAACRGKVGKKGLGPGGTKGVYAVKGRHVSSEGRQTENVRPMPNIKIQRGDRVKVTHANARYQAELLPTSWTSEASSASLDGSLSNPGRLAPVAYTPTTRTGQPPERRIAPARPRSPGARAISRQPRMAPRRAELPEQHQSE